MFWIIFNTFYNEIITFVNSINQNGNLLFLSIYIHFFFKDIYTLQLSIKI